MAKNTPLSSADARLQQYLPDSVDIREATWNHKQSGMNIVKHKYLKQIAGLQQIRVVPESVKLDFFAERNKSICFVMVETKDKQTYCSVAEADPANNKNAYPAMMAYKRAVDRAILEALNLQGFFYSESEIALTDSEAEAAQRRSDDAIKEPEPTPEAKTVKAQLEQKPISVLDTLCTQLSQAQNLEALISNKEAIKGSGEFAGLSNDDKKQFVAKFKELAQEFQIPAQAAE